LKMRLAIRYESRSVKVVSQERVTKDTLNAGLYVMAYWLALI
jgi:hypothetical protein